MKTRFILPLLALLSIRCAAQSLPDPGFEDVAYDSSSGLYSFNQWVNDGFGGGPTTDAPLGGGYSMSVWNWYWYGPGMGRNGTTPIFSVTQYMDGGTPCSLMPTRLDGFYRYDTTQAFRPGLPDSAVVVVGLKRWNASLGKADTIAYAIKHLPSTGVPAEWVPFSMDIDSWAPGVVPDSIVVTFRSSISGFCSASSSGNCLYFSVDDLSLVSTGMDGMETRSPLQLAPNPVKEKTDLQMSGMLPSDEVVIRDMTGHVLVRHSIGELDSRLTPQAWGLTSGIYLVSLQRRGEVIATARMMVE